MIRLISFLLIALGFGFSLSRFVASKTGCPEVGQANHRGRSGGVDCVFPFHNPAAKSDAPFLGEKQKARFQESLKVAGSFRFPNLFALQRSVWNGDASLFPRQFINDYYAMGLGHVIALSGQHIAVFVVVVSFFLNSLVRVIPGLQRTLCFCRREMPWICALVLVVSSGGVPSALRAFAVVAVLRWLRFLKRYSSSLQIQCSTIALCLVLEPSLLANIGFLLSSVAVGLLTLVRTTDQKGPPWKRYVTTSLVMPVLLSPIQAFYFSRWTPMASIAVLLLSWVWDFVWIPLGFLAPLIMVFPLTVLADGSEWLLGQFLSKSPLLHAWLVASNFVIPRPTWWEAGLAIWILAICIGRMASMRERG